MNTPTRDAGRTSESSPAAPRIAFYGRTPEDGIDLHIALSDQLRRCQQALSTFPTTAVYFDINDWSKDPNPDPADVTGSRPSFAHAPYPEGTLASDHKPARTRRRRPRPPTEDHTPASRRHSNDGPNPDKATP
jgi:hypothetical protein